MMNQKTKKALNIVSYVLIGLIALMAIMVLMLNITSQSRGEPSKLFGVSVLVVETNSMKRTYKGDSEDGIPNDITFKKGDLIFIKRLASLQARSDCKVGDVIVYHDLANKRLNAHKVVGVTESEGKVSYITRGVGLGVNTATGEEFQIPQNETGNDSHFYDNNADYTLDAASVIGVYTGKLVGIGAVFEFFQGFVGFGLLIVLPMFAFLAYRIYIVVKLAIAVNKEKKEGTTVSEVEAMQAEIERLKAELQGEKAPNTGPENES